MRRWILARLLIIASSTVQVAQPGYWDALYAESLRLKVKDFNASWQDLTFEKLSEALGERLQLRQDLRVVVLGSGDSLLPEEIHHRGVSDVIAIDLSPRLQERNRPFLRCLMEDARSQTSLDASSVDMIIELGLLDVILAEADLEGATGLLREARRLLRAGGLFISGSTDIPKFRQPLLEHPAGGWSDSEVLRLERPYSLDQRVKDLDPSWEVDKIFVYLNLAAGEVEVGQASARRPPQPVAGSAETPSPEAVAPSPAPVEEAAPSPEAVAPSPAPVEAAAPSPEAVAPPVAPVEAAAPSPEAAASPPAPVEAAVPSPEAAAPAPVEAPEEAAAPPPAPVEAAAPSPEAAEPAPVEAAAPSPEAATALPPAPVEAAAPSPEEAAALPEDPAEAFAESIRRLQAQAAALAS
eukprot:symbB.v1.2.000252.t1/scaffold18.1/size444001/9